MFGGDPQAALDVVDRELRETVLVGAGDRASLMRELAVLIGEVLADGDGIDDVVVAVFEDGDLQGRVDRTQRLVSRAG